MPIRGGFDPSSQVFRTTISGAVTYADIRQHIDVVSRVQAFRYPELLDGRQITEVQVGARDLMKLAHTAREVLGDTNPAPRAVIVEDLSHFGLARLFSSFVAGWMRVAVFDDVRAAETWITGPARLE